MDTVRSVLAGPTLPRELLVVDQSAAANPEVASLRRVEGCDVHYLHSATTGLDRARNIGLRAAANDVVVLLDDDMLVEDHWLSSLLSGLPEGPHGVATGRVLAAPASRAGDAVPPAALVTRECQAVYRGPQPLDVVPGANVALPRRLVLDLGGFDERLGAGTRFHAADDNDMGHRILLAGCEVRHVPGAVALHRAWRPRSERLRLRWRYGRGKGRSTPSTSGLAMPTYERGPARSFATASGALLPGCLRRLGPPPPSSSRWAAFFSGVLGWIAHERTRGRRGG